MLVRTVIISILIVLSAATPGLVISPIVAQAVASPRNVILFYDDYPTRKDPNFQVTKEIAMPLVAHIDQSGKPTDWMFDSFIFYSIWLYFDRNPTQKYVDSWISYLFDGRQIANLNAAVAATKTVLNQPSYKMNVFLAIPVATSAVKTSAITKTIDTILSKWNKLNPKDLQLVGFYWGFSEGLATKNTDLTTIVQGVAGHVHSKGLKMLIIPYRHAYGYQYVHSVGIDYATMQPNYAWYSDNNLAAFAKVDDSIRAGYMDGAEFELPVSSSSLQCCSGDWRTNLKTYFDQAYVYKWYSRLIQTYYHGSDISSMGRQSGSDYRAAYETIYQYILATRGASSTSTHPPPIRCNLLLFCI